MSDVGKPSSNYPHSLEDTVLQREDALYRGAAKSNIENFVGTVRVPVGIAGPVHVRGDEAKGEFYIPFATTEGTLVASTSRGMKVINESGGARVAVVSNGGIQRAPVFEFENFDQAREFTDSMNADWSWLVPVLEESTAHGKVLDVHCWQLASKVCMRVTMDSGDASGQNMVSIATANAVVAILKKYPEIVRHRMAGGLSGEKVASHVNALHGRGKNVIVSVDIPGEVMERVTRADIKDIPRLHRSCADFNLLAGSHNSHCSHSNALTAIYIATGQDPATIPEAAFAQNSIEFDEGSNTLRWEVHIPNMNVGTVGGGTGLPTQRECLEIMECYGSGMVNKFAELCAVASMANEISFWGSVCAQEWVRAHAELKKK